ncbi:hypothetical protein [Synechococcus sp. CCAP 1479/9]|nr:hypothetical protein [Synechococcus sp. CCAP 1479/9]
MDDTTQRTGRHQQAFNPLAAHAGICLRCPYKGLARYGSITASRSGVDR